MIKKDLIIVGGGSAGIAAAISAYENGIKDLLILEKENCLGGILQQCIHNGFGLETFKEQLSGPEYAQRYIDKLEHYQLDYRLETTVLEINKDKIVTYSNEKEGVVKVQAKAIIMATGCFERTPGAIMLEGARVSGILTAGLAQKYLNIDGYLVGKKVFILGSGDIGLIMARRFSLEGAKVLGVAEIMPYSSGLNRNIVQCLQDFDIPLYLSHTVKKVIGKDRVEKIIIAQVDSQFNYIENSEKEFKCDCLILSVGLIPYNPLIENIVKINPKTKAPYVDENYQTSVPGIFACGNSLHVHDLVDFVSLESSLAGKGAANYLKNNFKKCKSIIIKAGSNLNYIIPNQVEVANLETDLILKFRVKKPLQKSQILILENDKVIKKIIKPYLLPAEMVQIKLPKVLLEEVNKEIVISVNEVE